MEAETDMVDVVMVDLRMVHADEEAARARQLVL